MKSLSLFFFSSYKDTNPIKRAPISGLHLNLIISKGIISKYHLPSFRGEGAEKGRGLRLHQMNFGDRETIQSITTTVLRSSIKLTAPCKQEHILPQENNSKSKDYKYKMQFAHQFGKRTQNRGSSGPEETHLL